MLLQMASFHSFLWLRNIPLCKYTVSSLCIHLRMDIWIAPTPWLFYLLTVGCAGLHCLPGLSGRGRGAPFLLRCKGPLRWLPPLSSQALGLAGSAVGLVGPRV